MKHKQNNYLTATTLGIFLAFILAIILSCKSYAEPNVWLTTSISTAPAPKDLNFFHRKLNRALNIGFDLNKNIYVVNEIKMYSNRKFGYVSTYGLKDSTGYLRPYGEVSYSSHSNKIDYSIGAGIYLLGRITPFLEVTDFLSQQDESFALGIKAHIWKGLYTSFAFEVVKSTQENMCKFSVTYLI